MIRERTVTLNCHPATCSLGVRDIGVHVHRTPSGTLELRYRLSGDLRGIRIPADGSARLGSELWRHTCFEAFVALDDQPAYHEFNFAPSGAWAACGFDAYRTRSVIRNPVEPPSIEVRTARDRLELDAVVRLESLSPEHASARLRIGLSAVIEATDEGLSYWALHHPADRPDFHHPGAFVLCLEALRE
jgi:hypothetical protein